MDLPSAPAAKNLPAKAGETFVCIECQTGPDLKAEFEIIRAGRDGYRYQFPCKGHREGCKGIVTLNRREIEDFVTLHEAGKAHGLLNRLEEVFDQNVSDAKNPGFDAGERATATHAAVAVAKLKLQVGGILQKQGTPVTVQNQVSVQNFSPDGPVVKRLMEIARERFNDRLPEPKPGDTAEPVSQAAIADLSIEGIL